MRAIDMAGKRFGRLLVVSRADSPDNSARWLCRCDCGTDTIKIGKVLRKGRAHSCGCFRREFVGDSKRKHGHCGLTRTRTYRTWLGMIQRCRNPKRDNFKHYGGRGISVCKRWSDSFENFLADMGPRPDGVTLDRIDNSRGYEPGNCRWATQRVQRMNSRSAKLEPHEPIQIAWLIKSGQSKQDVAAFFGVSASYAGAIWTRLRDTV